MRYLNVNRERKKVRSKGHTHWRSMRAGFTRNPYSVMPNEWTARVYCECMIFSETCIITHHPRNKNTAINYNALKKSAWRWVADVTWDLNEGESAHRLQLITRCNWFIWSFIWTWSNITHNKHVIFFSSGKHKFQTRIRCRGDHGYIWWPMLYMHVFYWVDVVNNIVKFGDRSATCN